MMGRKKAKAPSLSSYFRKVFTDHPDWLDLDHNQNVVAQWKQDHNGQEMTKREKGVMANMKSKMRAEKRGGRKKGRRLKLTGPRVSARAALADVERLEGMIDSCLAEARSLQVQGIELVTNHLRRARNNIVLLFDEKG